MNEKIEQFWRPADEDDIAKVMRGEKVEARFRDREKDAWSVNRYLGGFDATSVNGYFWISEEAGRWRICQVYDPPAWFLNKPDPGEGYRLLEKFPPEPKQRRDWYWDKNRSVWSLVLSDGDQAEDVYYRRRIEHADEKPDPGESKKPLLIRRWSVEVGDEVILPTGKMLVIKKEGFEVL
jgi:hypothetical protein